MKKIIPAALPPLLLAMLLAAAGLGTAACSKDVQLPASTPDFSATDEALISKYVADHQLSRAVRQPSGLYYVPVTTNPNGVQATVGSTVSVLYTGTYLDGTVFDASSQYNNVPITFALGTSQIIPGWNEGIALMRKSEKSILLIPSKLAYGNAGKGTVPPNTVLRFDVELTAVR